ncbi:MAG: sigma-70 family RNA polymerase sigma factor [Candidatus Hydrogenedentota bacterium]
MSPAKNKATDTHPKNKAPGKPSSEATPAEMKKTQEPTVARSEDFENLVLEHLDMMYAVALRLTRNAADAQDLTQNTLVKALRFHEKFKEGTYIKAWLLTILRNTFINEYRRKVRRPTFVELSGTEQAEDRTPDPDVSFEPAPDNREDLLELLDDEVKEAVESLPEDFRYAVIMADLQDKSYKEIAEAMDCPLGTVMSRLYRGRKLLRGRLLEYAKERRLVSSETEK